MPSPPPPASCPPASVRPRSLCSSPPDDVAARYPGSRADPNGDFAAQGIANLASGLFRGLPVGGSVGRTAIDLTAGARTRWAAITSGFWELLVLVLLGGVVGLVALPTLAAVLVFAAIGSIRPAEIATVMRTAMVALSLMLQLRTEAMDLTVVEIVPQPDGRIRERPPPPSLPSRQVTALDVYGSLLYAGARTLQVRLPDPTGSTSPAVVLRLRGRTSLGATFFVVLADYANRLDQAGGRLFLSGVDPATLERMTRSRRLDASGPVQVHQATAVVGESTWPPTTRQKHDWSVTRHPEHRAALRLPCPGSATHAEAELAAGADRAG